MFKTELDKSLEFKLSTVSCKSAKYLSVDCLIHSVDHVVRVITTAVND